MTRVERKCKKWIRIAVKKLSKISHTKVFELKDLFSGDDGYRWEDVNEDIAVTTFGRIFKRYIIAHPAIGVRFVRTRSDRHAVYQKSGSNFGCTK